MNSNISHLTRFHHFHCSLFQDGHILFELIFKVEVDGVEGVREEFGGNEHKWNKFAFNIKLKYTTGGLLSREEINQVLKNIILKQTYNEI